MWCRFRRADAFESWHASDTRSTVPNRMIVRFVTNFIFTVVVLAQSISAAPPELTRKDLPRVPATELDAVQQTFQIKPGFQLQIAAAEPNIYDPIEVCFDENGRMFVVEMRDYSELRDSNPHLGRIRVLEDRDGDGVFESSKVYADDLPWPTGVICYDGGIYVLATPDLLYLKDTNGDGTADERKVVFTGFGVDRDRLNVQALANCLRWGLDNRIHGQTSGNGGRVRRADQPDAQPLNLNGRDFAFDPRTHELFAEAGGGQYGMCFDDHGRRYVCSNSRHIMTFMYDQRYAERNPLFDMPAPLVDIPVDGPAAEVYRTSPEEAWRVIRTKWRVTGVVQGLIEGGGRSSGYFTGATGISIYRGDAWPADYLGDAFIADVGSNLIHRKQIHLNGVEPVAIRPADEQKVEFITSRDLWFRPVEMVNAPDGCLYLCDMYREVIEHPWSLPENIKKLIDLNSGNDRGRIYRIAPDGFRPRPLPQLGRATTAELVATLENRNAWYRETAARLLFERQDKQAISLLRKLQTGSPNPLARLHALHALDGLGALAEEDVLHALNDSDNYVREHGIKLAENFVVGGQVSSALWTRLQSLAGDSASNVRYQLAFTLGELANTNRLALLADIARRDSESRWIRAAILSSLANGAGEVFRDLTSDANYRSSPGAREFLPQLVSLVGAQNRADDVGESLTFLTGLEDSALKFSMADHLNRGLHRAGKSLATAGEPAARLLALATTSAVDKKAPDDARLPAIRLLAEKPFTDVSNELFGLLERDGSQDLRLTALESLATFSNPEVGTRLAARWRELPARLRAETLTILLSRPDRARALLLAIQSGSIFPNALNSSQAHALRDHRDAEIRALANQVLPAVVSQSRQEIINQFEPAVALNGDVAHGQTIYRERCISCHRSGGEGSALGPDFVTVKTTGKEKLLTNIIDPNREVRPEFAASTIETKDGSSRVGLVVNETASAVTIRQAFGKEEVLQRADIVKKESQGQSLMPEGLEQNLTTQDMADLLDYISSADK